MIKAVVKRIDLFFVVQINENDLSEHRKLKYINPDVPDSPNSVFIVIRCVHDTAQMHKVAQYFLNIKTNSNKGY